MVIIIILNHNHNLEWNRIANGRNRMDPRLIFYWTCTCKPDSGCGYSGRFKKDCAQKFRDIFAKAVAKEKVPMEAHSPYGTFAWSTKNDGASLRNHEISKHDLAPTLGRLSDHSHSCCLHAAQKLPQCHHPVKENAVSRTNAKEHVFFAKNCHLQMKECRSTAVHPKSSNLHRE